MDNVLWRKAFPEPMAIAPDTDWLQIVDRYELASASIMNVMHCCIVKALANCFYVLTSRQLEAAILREFMKEGESLPAAGHSAGVPV